MSTREDLEKALKDAAGDAAAAWTAYNKSFVGGLTEEEVRFLVLHERLHKYFRHLHTRKL